MAEPFKKTHREFCGGIKIEYAVKGFWVKTSIDVEQGVDFDGNYEQPTIHRGGGGQHTGDMIGADENFALALLDAVGEARALEKRTGTKAPPRNFVEK